MGFCQWGFKPSQAHPTGTGRSPFFPFKLRAHGRAVPAPPDVTAGVTPGLGTVLPGQGLALSLGWQQTRPYLLSLISWANSGVAPCLARTMVDYPDV